jgi:predicted dehydrogenase
LTLRGAVVGFGQVAEKAHAPAFRRSGRFEIVAVADSGAGRLAAARDCFPGARPYPGIEPLLKSERLDFVDIATPPRLHHAQALASLRAGLHVLCEKPLVFSSREFSELQAEARARGRVLFPVHNWKYAPLFLRLRELLRSGAVGEIRHAELHVLRSKPAATAGGEGGNWRTDRALSGGGILADHGWHNLYLLSWLLGGRPEMAGRVLRHPPGGGAEDEASCLLRFPGATALLHMTWRSPVRAQWGVVYGTQGSIGMIDDRLVMAGGGQPRTFSFPEKLSQGSAHPEWFASLLLDFHAAASGSDASAAREALEEAGLCAALIEEAYRP